jgi:hypothetical protein
MHPIGAFKISGFWYRTKDEKIPECYKLYSITKLYGNYSQKSTVYPKYATVYQKGID